MVRWSVSGGGSGLLHQSYAQTVVQKHAKLQLSDRLYHFVSSGLSKDRDENASINLEHYLEYDKEKHTGRSPEINAVGDEGSVVLA